MFVCASHDQVSSTRPNARHGTLILDSHRTEEKGVAWFSRKQRNKVLTLAHAQTIHYTSNYTN